MHPPTSLMEALRRHSAGERSPGLLPFILGHTEACSYAPESPALWKARGYLPVATWEPPVPTGLPEILKELLHHWSPILAYAADLREFTGCMGPDSPVLVRVRWAELPGSCMLVICAELTAPDIPETHRMVLRRRWNAMARHRLKAIAPLGPVNRAHLEGVLTAKGRPSPETLNSFAEGVMCEIRSFQEALSHGD